MMEKKIDKEALECLMSNLVQKVPIFCSSADFEHNFARIVEDTYADDGVGVYVGYRKEDMDLEPGRKNIWFNRGAYLNNRKDENDEEEDVVNIEEENYRNGRGGELMDVLICLNGEKIPVELRYVTVTGGRAAGPNFVECKDGYANMRIRNCRTTLPYRYGFFRDIAELEDVVNNGTWTKRGYAIFLTNDSRYWSKGDDVRVHHGFQFYDSGVLEKGEYSLGTVMGSPIILNNSYEIKWHFFTSNVRIDCPRRFAYTIVEITEPSTTVL